MSASRTAQRHHHSSLVAGHRKIPISGHAIHGGAKLRRTQAEFARELLCPRCVPSWRCLAPSEVAAVLLVLFEHVGVLQRPARCSPSGSAEGSVRPLPQVCDLSMCHPS